MRPPKRDNCQQKSLLWIRISCDINLPDVFIQATYLFSSFFFFGATALQISPNHCEIPARLDRATSKHISPLFTFNRMMVSTGAGVPALLLQLSSV